MRKLYFLLALFVITITFFFFLEIFSRILLGMPTSTQSTQVTESDPVFNHKWKPNLKSIDRSRSVSYMAYTNSQSWVERHEIALEKPKNTIRIFYVGDSNTAGVVEENKKMPTIVEKALNNRLAKENKIIEVINTGTPSWSPSLYYLEIKKNILRYSPDIVVINIDMTDVRDDLIYRKLTKFDENGLPLAVKPSDEKDKAKYILAPQGVTRVSFIQEKINIFNTFLRSNSVFYHHFEKFAIGVKSKLRRKYSPPRNTLTNEDTEAANWVSHDWKKETELNAEYSMQLLGHIIVLLKENDVKVIVTGVPLYPQYSGEWSSKPHGIIANTAKKHGALYLNSFDSLKDSVRNADRSKYYWEEDPTHFNEAGYKIWAEVQADFLIKNVFNTNAG